MTDDFIRLVLDEIEHELETLDYTHKCLHEIPYDPNLIDVFCQHDFPWWECEACVEQLNLALLAINIEENNYGYLD